MLPMDELIFLELLLLISANSATTIINEANTVMKYIKTRFKVSSINSTARITSQYYTLLISIKNCKTSTYLTDYINVLRLTQQMTAYGALQ